MTGRRERDRRTRVTSVDVARLANVSQTTVSFVLNDVSGKRISEATRQSVLAAARELNYHPNRSARDLASGVTSTVTCVVTHPFFGEGMLPLLSALTAELACQGLLLSVWFESEDRTAFAISLRETRPAAVFSLFGDLPEWIREHDQLQGAQVIPELDFAPDLTDPGTTAQIAYLADKGHRQIAYIAVADDAMASIMELRIASAVAACATHGLDELRTERVGLGGLGADEALRRSIDSGVTALCCTTDRIAFIMLDALRRMGIRCPEDVAVMGYDAIALSAWSAPPLTTIRWQPAEIAKAYANAIASTLDLPTGGPLTPPTIESLDITVVRRSSA